MRSSSETRRIDPNQDTTFLVESVIPRGKYVKAYGKCFVEIYKIDSQYLHWLETTDRLFRIDFDKLKELCPDAENSINKSVGENNKLIDLQQVQANIPKSIKVRQFMVSPLFILLITEKS